MPSTVELRSVVGPLLQLAPDQMSPNTSLQRFGGSLERTKLELALRRIGLTLPPGLVGPRLSDLESRLGLNGAMTPAEPSAAFAPATASATPLETGTPSDALNIGVDIEMISALPEAADPWENEFYTNTFTSSEIAACLVQQSPRMHFAGNWCAKEALRKSSPAYTRLGWQSIRVDHTATGAPFLQIMHDGTWKTLPCAVSIAHTDSMAAAVVAWARSQPTTLATVMESPASVSPQPQPSMTSRVALGLSLLALAASGFALAQALR